MEQHGNYPETGFWEINLVAVSQFDFFQPTIQPTKTYFLYDFQVVWQSPQSRKLL